MISSLRGASRRAMTCGLFLATTSACAMGADATTTLEEVIVTAQKRAQSVQDVPIAVSAFGAEALKERAVGNVSQLANIAPNVSLDAGTPFSGSTAVLSAFIRGVGSDDFAFNIDPGVGVYMDGVYIARSVGANQDLLDVERIEILKGPQGTLFGRNTIGGAISIVTRDPGEEFSFTGDVTTGSYNLLKIRGVADIPLADNLAAMLTFASKSREGYVKRIPFPDQRARNATSNDAYLHAGYDTSDTEGGDNDITLRSKLKWDNGGDFSFVLGADYMKSNSTGLPNTLLSTLEDAPLNFAGTMNLPGTGFDPTGTTGFNFAGLYNFCIGATTAEIAARGATGLCGARGTTLNPGLLLPSFAGVNVDGDPLNDQLPFDGRYISGDIDTSYATGNSFSDLENWGMTATADYDLAENTTIKSITAYRQLTWQSGMDADGSPLTMAHLSFDQNQWQFSEELQLLGSTLDDKLDYVFGAYYFKEKGDLHDYVIFDEGLLQVDGFNTFDTENQAVFGQVDYQVSALISVTAGGRYTHEKKLFEGFQQDLNGFNYKLFGCSDDAGNVGGIFPLAPIPCQVALSYPDPDNPIRVYPPGVNEKSFNNFSPKFGLQLHPSDDIMVYGSWSRGYKTGGWTTRFTNPQLEPGEFNEEIATTWEVGVKADLMRKRLRINAAAFTTDYDGIQLNFQEGTSPTIQNAGDARIKGFEIELLAAPADGLTISSSLGYIDSRYTAVLDGVLVVGGPNALQAGTFVGADLPKSPKWKFNISPRYEVFLEGGASLVLLADYTYQSSSWNTAQRNFSTQRDSSDMLNASVTYHEPGQKWSVTVGGTNLTDERFLTTGGENLAAGVEFGTYNRPREWYARFGVAF